MYYYYFCVKLETNARQYGVMFSVSFDINLDKMLDLLDKGKILYVMYWESSGQEGHSVIIQGYWKLGDSVYFFYVPSSL